MEGPIRLLTRGEKDNLKASDRVLIGKDRREVFFVKRDARSGLIKYVCKDRDGKLYRSDMIYSDKIR